MDLTTNTIKYILFLSNLFFVVCGLLLVIFGCIDAFGDDISTKILEEHNFTIVGTFFIFIGLSIFIVTFFGCWGAFYEKYSMLYTYGILLSVLLLLQLIFYGIVLYFCKKDSNGLYSKIAVEHFFGKYYGRRNNQDIINVVDNIQKSYSCCGVEGPEFWKSYGKQYPPSCCSTKAINPTAGCQSSEVYRKGCLHDIKEYIASKFRLSYIVCSLAVQILVIGSTFYLAKDLRTADRTNYDAI